MAVRLKNDIEKGRNKNPGKGRGYRLKADPDIAVEIGRMSWKNRKPS